MLLHAPRALRWARSKMAFGRSAWGKVAPKYRNPHNSAETWAGRGLKPRWLVAAIKYRKKLEAFLIAGSAYSSTANGRKKVRKPRGVPPSGRTCAAHRSDEGRPGQLGPVTAFYLPF